jgi:hypothetical protein
MTSGTFQCGGCGTIVAKALHSVCPVCDSEGPGKLPPPPLTSQDRLAILWEQQKHLLPDGELKAFICRAVMLARERRRGGEPPKARP